MRSFRYFVPHDACWSNWKLSATLLKDELLQGLRYRPSKLTTTGFIAGLSPSPLGRAQALQVPMRSVQSFPALERASGLRRFPVGLLRLKSSGYFISRSSTGANK